MIIINIIGGLGNQMFQYAMGKALAIQSKQKLKLDTTGFENYALRNFELDVFNIDPEIASTEEIAQVKQNELDFTEKYFHFDPEVLDFSHSVYLKGYWQSEKYFIAYKDLICKELTLKDELSHQSNQFQKAITSTNSVSLHIRRGDYVTNSKTNSFHGTCSLEYYKNAISLVSSRLDNPHFFIFSDDLDWTQENLDFIDNITFVELDKNIPDHEEMYLMSQCKHNIIANSSFSWWGAWLNQNPEKIVIAPEKWFIDETMDTKDLIPNSWIRLSDEPFKVNDLVSIVIPCYNQAQYLEEAVMSAIKQTYPSIEIIIVNDGSPDNTQEIASNLQKKYPNIIRVVKQENQGLSQARNNGIKEALGNYILPLDADDILNEKLVSHCLYAIIKNNVDIVYFDLQCFGENQHIAYRKPFSENNILYENLPPPSSLYRKKVWEKISGYKLNMDLGYEDWEFWINAYKHNFTFYYLPEILFNYRVKKESRDTNAVTKHTYLCSKIIMNHPDLYTINQVQEAINTIKETEKLADFYFYYDKNIPDNEKTWITEVGHYIDNNQLEKKQIIEIHKNKVGLCTLDSLKNNMSIQRLYRKMDVDFILFYAPLRFELETLRISNFAWKKDEGIIKAHGTLFTFIPKPKRESPKKQLIAYQRFLRYQTMKKNYLVSIIIPCYNQAQYLKESVESVINQTYQNIEIIIVNDGSTDVSSQVAREMIKNNSTKRIQLINQANMGLAEARNSGIRAALGEYIFTLDADDKLNKNILQKGMNAMIEHSVDVVYTDYRCFDEKNTIVNTISTVDLYFILYSNITGATALYKKSLWKKIGGYKPNMNGGYEDWEFWVNATKHGFKFYRIPLVLFYYRVKKESMYIDALKKHTYLYSKIVINHPEQYTNIQRNNAIKSINEFEDSADIYFYFNTQNCVNEKEIISLIINSINNNKLNNLFQSGENYIIPAQDKFYSIALYNLESNDKSMKQNVDHIVYYAKLKYDFTNDTFDKLKCSSLAWNAEKGIVQSQGTIFPFTFLNDLSFETEANKRFDEFTNYGSLIRAIRQKKSDISNLELEIKNLMIQEKLLLQELR